MPKAQYVEVTCRVKVKDLQKLFAAGDVEISREKLNLLVHEPSFQKSLAGDLVDCWFLLNDDGDPFETVQKLIPGMPAHFDSVFKRRASGLWRKYNLKQDDGSDD